MRRDSFERFYLQNVALGEGCGCAEHVTRLWEIDRLAEPARATRQPPMVLAVMRTLWRAFPRTSSGRGTGW